jgi:hypothetical protein
LNIENIHDSYSIEILNIKGLRLFSQKDIQLNKITLDYLAEGVYFFRIIKDKGIYSDKFIVSK